MCSSSIWQKGKSLNKERMARFIALPNLFSSIFVLVYLSVIFHLVYRHDDILIGKLPETLQKCEYFLLLLAWVYMLFLVAKPDLSWVISRFNRNLECYYCICPISWISIIFFIHNLRYFGNCTGRSIHLCAFCVRCSLSRYDSTGNIHNSRR